MKKVFCPLVLLLVFNWAAEAQVTPWQAVNPLPQSQLLNNLWTFGPDSVVAVGGGGTIIRTTNGGQTWNVQQSVLSDTDFFNDVQFISPTVGWVVGDDGYVYKTTDGGQSWDDMEFPDGNTLLGVHFITASTGWVCGFTGLIYKSTDGGDTWAEQTTNIKNTLFSIHFITPQLGFAFGTKGMRLKTTDGGTTWVPKTLDSTRSLYSSSFVSSTVGWASGGSGYIVKTTDAGETWAKQTVPLQTGLFSINFIDASNGMASGSLGSIVRTSDGGQTWFSVLPDLNDDMSFTRFANASVGWAVGDLGRILRSTDGGWTWNLRSSGAKADMFASYFPSINTGWSVGDTGVIIKTTNGGASWISQKYQLDWPLYGVYFVNNQLGWAVGDSGYILKTTDGGSNWTAKVWHTASTLYSVFFIDSSRGWIGGADGTLLRTTNGGALWGAQDPKSIDVITQVRFFNQTTGLATVSDGTIRKTTNGGTTWVPKSTGVEQTIYSLSILPDSTVYATGDFGEIIKSSNLGETWQDISLATTTSYYGAAFYNGQIGWAGGDDGEIISTTNGGADWYLDINPALTTFFTLQAIPSGNGALVLASGISSTMISASVNAFQQKTWTGAVDSLWTNGLNWNPAGVPGRVDSVVIPAVANQPVINTISQEIDLGSLRISAGARLRVAPGLSQLVSGGNVMIDGQFSADATTLTRIITGGDLVASGTVVPGKSTFICNGVGALRGTFYDLAIGSEGAMTSSGNIVVTHSLRVATSITMRQTDTLTIRNPAGQGFSGNGFVTPGTIKRLIAPGSLDIFRFESPATAIQFLGTGTNPDSILMTTYLNSKPPNYPDTQFVSPSYGITSMGGSNPKASLCLRYDDSNVSASQSIGIFRDSSGILINMGFDDFPNSDYAGSCLDSTYLYSRWYLGRYEYVPRLQYQFNNRLIVSDNGNHKDTLRWGAQPGATTGVDAIFGETALGATPPAGTFDARWRLSVSVTSRTDVLPQITTSSPTNTYKCEFQPGAGGYPVTIHWDSTEFPLGNVTLMDAATNGAKYKVYMRKNFSVVISDTSVHAVIITTKVPAFYAYTANWNMIAMAQIPTLSSRVSFNFPLATSRAYLYRNGYIVSDTLKNGPAYWLKFKTAISVPIMGEPLTNITIPVDSGWNMIGSISNAIPVGAVVPSIAGLLASPVKYYSYKTGYVVTDSIRPGYGYWVKAVKKGGSLTLTTTSSAKQSPALLPDDPLAGLNSVTVGDGSGGQQQLYFGEQDEKKGLMGDLYEMPPAPPAGIFDASFDSRRMFAALEFRNSGSVDLPITIQAAGYPLTIQPSITDERIHSLFVVNPATGKVLGEVDARHRGKIVVSDASISKIMLRVSYDAAGIPKEFALMQNFPNPFNPTTTIRFQLPVQASVTLELYNILGQRVRFLLDQQQLSAGTHNITLDASSLATGVYFYRLTANTGNGKGSAFHDVKKLLLMK